MKNASAVGWAALGMFVWGVFKASVVSKHSRVPCPLCVARDASDPRKLTHSLVVGPLMEEANYRHSLPKMIGPAGSAAVFGAMHGESGLSPAANAARVAEAGLAGGLVYQKAYDQGGLVGSVLVHGAHNLGVDVGTFLAMRRRADEEGWRQVRVPVRDSAGRVTGHFDVCERHGH